MAEISPEDQAAKSRIVKHMNQDHHDSIIRYLQHFSNLSIWTASSGRLQDMDLTSLTLTCKNKTYRIPFTPPLKSYREARERVVQLDKECRKALGQSDVTVKSYIVPTGYHAIPFLVVLATFIAYSQRGWFAPGQIVERILGSGFANFSWMIQPKLLAGLIVIHGGEMLYFAAVKLKRHSVNMRSSAWWLWTASTFIEGQFAYKRFDAHVKAIREKQKH
ncbi:related to integral membrane protein [Ramularia collo-cygni]|uniref:Related to integral membrane protein n=1 Tax=Ramularia collo-cygni TaxID=112498 RepID=A0A2D3V0C8_9PEZI|nr:related to integral membrane protein [Ramularia collo-cygni]CZT22826.1 related to integral membrane protein [Ramularia collo-cygni]